MRAILSVRNFLAFCLVTGFFCLAGTPGPHAAAVAASSAVLDLSSLREGDIVFQNSRSRQSLALQIATRSPYTHCGVLFRRSGRWEVFEAASTVGWTPLDAWIARGINGHYLIMRLKDLSALTPTVLTSMRADSLHYVGKAYDLLFQWSDDTMYCSELVWKLYQRAAHVELGPLHSFYDYNLDHQEVQAIIRMRYGAPLPAEEKVVAPSDLIRCGLLETVAAN
jgi:hypothetical protein